MMAQYNQSLRLSVICFLKEITFKLVEQKIEENYQRVVVEAGEILEKLQMYVKKLDCVQQMEIQLILVSRFVLIKCPIS